MFPPDCPYLEVDAVFGVKDSLIGDFKRVDDKAEAEKFGFAGPFWSLEWNFALASEARPPRANAK